MVSQRSIAQGFLGLQAVLTVGMAVALVSQERPLAPSVIALALAASVSGLLLAGRNVQLEARPPRTDRAPRREATAREPIPDSVRGEEEAASSRLQRLESVSKLAGAVAHDFNNLLTVIGASASMAERALAAGTSPADDLHEIHQAVGRASELTKHLLTLARRPASAAEAGPATSGVQPIAGKRARVLVVEDEPQVRAIASRSLSAGGFEVFQAANGALALAMLKEQALALDVLVTDVMMPELSGPELARAARAADPTLELVFMSGFPQVMGPHELEEFQGAIFLAKPFSPQKLVQAVHECVARRSPEALQHVAKR